MCIRDSINAEYGEICRLNPSSLTVVLPVRATMEGSWANLDPGTYAEDAEQPEGADAPVEARLPPPSPTIASLAENPNGLYEHIEVLENFAMVAPGIYRSSFPKKKNYQFLKRLKIKTILFLAHEEYPDAHVEWMSQNGLQLRQHGVSGNKEPFVEIEPQVIVNALVTLLDVRNHPVLIHCNKGKHRTGCLVGCLRKIMRWCKTSIFEEYRRFAGIKARRADQEFIELFETRKVTVLAEHLPTWLYDEWIEQSLTLDKS
eukprot:TRINITY_DN15766_c0_g1_i1.p1 TRINITY_DN15766_c0_g1~~TRINITY_DN15766_c0_g1_i1.p1  ORF type:complete len:259 (+),score=76.41 TRINITY_DN15766_c0_g1_i1:115-891(+)